MNAKKINNSNYSEELIQRIEVENTPFIIIKDEKGAYATLGKYRITDVGKVEEILEKIESTRINWELLTAVVGVIAKTVTEMEAEEEKIKNTKNK